MPEFHCYTLWWQLLHLLVREADSEDELLPPRPAQQRLQSAQDSAVAAVRPKGKQEGRALRGAEVHVFDLLFEAITSEQ